jgi:hypothetical protein
MPDLHCTYSVWVQTDAAQKRSSTARKTPFRGFPSREEFADEHVRDKLLLPGIEERNEKPACRSESRQLLIRSALARGNLLKAQSAQRRNSASLSRESTQLCLTSDEDESVDWEACSVREKRTRSGLKSDASVSLQLAAFISVEDWGKSTVTARAMYGQGYQSLSEELSPPCARAAWSLICR